MMTTRVPYSRDTNKYYVFEQEFENGMEMRVSVYIKKSECPIPPVSGTFIQVDVSPVALVEDTLPKVENEEDNIPW